MGRRRKVAVIAVATVVVLAALGVAGWRLTRSDDTASATPRKSQQAAKAEAAKRAAASTTTKPGTTEPGEGCGWIRACKAVPVTGPVVIPDKAEQKEGDSGTSVLSIPVALYGASTKAVTVTWRTLYVKELDASVKEAQAKPFEDYVENTGTVTFRPGQTTQSVKVTVNGNTGAEDDEFLLISFVDAKNATVGGFLGLGGGMILDDD